MWKDTTWGGSRMTCRRPYLMTWFSPNPRLSQSRGNRRSSSTIVSLALALSQEIRGRLENRIEFIALLLSVLFVANRVFWWILVGYDDVKQQHYQHNQLPQPERSWLERFLISVKSSRHQTGNFQPLGHDQKKQSHQGERVQCVTAKSTKKFNDELWLDTKLQTIWC